MSFWDSFFGGQQEDDIRAAHAEANRQLETGFNAGQAGYTDAHRFIAPYTQSGTRANAMYADATGLNGTEPARRIASDFYANDPFRETNAEYADKNTLSRFNAMGAGDSGASRLAVARAGLERGSTDWNKWLDRIAGQGQQGFQAAGAEAGLTTGAADQAYGYGQTRAGNEINYGNAMASNRNTGLNNILGVAGTAIRAFTPTTSGRSPAGYAANAMRSWV